jgi:hypothetical protein
VPAIHKPRRLNKTAVWRSRRGLASALLAHAIRHAQAQRLRRCSLDVRTDNAAAQRLYRRHGFQVTRARPSFYADGGEALEMTLELLPASVVPPRTAAWFWREEHELPAMRLAGLAPPADGDHGSDGDDAAARRRQQATLLCARKWQALKRERPSEARQW